MRVLIALVSLLSLASASKLCLQAPCIPQAIDADFTFLVDSSTAVSDSDFTEVKQWLLDFISQLTLTNADSQIVIYTYSSRVQRYGSLTASNNRTVLTSSINAMILDNNSDRDLYQALTKEESEVNEYSGFRDGYKHIMIVVSADAWTGTNVLGSQLLVQVQQKYDMVMAIGLGAKSVQNQATALSQLTKNLSYVNYAFNINQLQFVTQWLYINACPGIGMPTTTVAPTAALPSQNPSVPCQLFALNYDVYLVVDTSAAMSASDFAQMKQALVDFVSPFPVGDGKTQFALVATAIDSELYGTSFHNGQDRRTLINTLQTLTQDASQGQTLKLSLQAINSTFLSHNYASKNKLLVYVTATTGWDTDPIQYMKQLSQTYALKTTAVQWTSNAASSSLSSFAGGQSCVSLVSNRSNMATWLQTKMCSQSFCL